MQARFIAFLCATPILLLITISQLNITTDISAFFVSGKSTQLKLFASQMQTGEISRRYLISIVQPQKGAQPLDFLHDFQRKLLQIDGIKKVWNGSMNDDDLHALIQFYAPYRYQIYSLQPQIDIPLAFSEQSMLQRAQMIKSGLLGAQSPWIQEILSQDPMFLMAHTFQNLAQSSQPYTPNRYTPLIVETTMSGLNSVQQSRIKQAIEASFQSLNQSYHGIYHLEMTGVPVFALAIKKQVESDVKWISTVSTCLMIFVFFTIFRSFHALLNTLLVLLVSASMASLISTLVFGQIYALTLALGTTLIGICVDYPIHTIVHIQNSKQTPTQTAKQLWPSLWLGALTTIIGYVALSFTGYPGLQQIALYSAIGIITSLLISRFILPFGMHASTSQRQPSQAMHYLSIGLKYLQTKHVQRPIVFMAFLMLLIGVSTVKWQDDLSQLSPSVASLKANDQKIRQRMQSIEPGRFILIHANSLEKALQISEQASLALKKLKKEGKLSSFYAIYPWLASQHLQQENFKTVQQSLTAEVRQQWSQSLEKVGLRSDFFSPIQLPPFTPLSIDKVLKSPAGSFISGQYMQHDGDVLLTIWLGSHQAEALKKTFTESKNIQYVSQKDMLNEMNAAYRSQAIVALSYASLFILALLVWRYKSIGVALLTLLPAMVAVAWMLGTWALLGYPLSILHVLGFLLSIAICVDYGIFFYENRSGNIYVTYQAIVLSAFTTMIAFFCLALADNPALQALAWTVAPGVCLGFILCPLLIHQNDQG